MPDFLTIVILTISVLAMLMTPGPDMMLVLGRGVGQGYRVAQATAVGIASAGLVQLPLLAFGLSEFVSSMPWLLDLIRLIGAAYLMYLGFKFLKNSNVSRPLTPRSQTTIRRAVFDGMLANLMNPKVIVFQLAFLPQFVDPQAGPIWSQLLVLGLVMKICGFAVMSIVALTSGQIGKWMSHHPNWLINQERFVGVILIATGLRLLMELGSEGKLARS